MSGSNGDGARRQTTKASRIAGVALIGFCAGTSPAAAQDATYHFKDTPIDWSACPDPMIEGLECAAYAVPLDYRKADGPTIELALRRMPARGGAAKGILFFNPGGPGGTGSVQFPQWYGQFPVAVRQSFDIVSWDPRGIGESTQGRCFDSADKEAALLGGLGAFPTTFAEQKAWSDAYAAFAKACAANASEILAHVSTADTARDLEQLRIATGGAPLNYWGVSYGTFLGATYANLFPEAIRTLVLDGNLSPLAWTADGDRNPQWTLGDRVGSPELASVFQHFLQLCAAAGPDRCGFAAASYDLTRQKWNDLLNRLSEGPIELKSGAGARTITLNTLVGQISDGMDIVWAVPGANGWASVGHALQAIHEAGAATPGAPHAGTGDPAGSKPAAYDGAEGAIAVMCGDAPAVSLERFPTLSSEVMLRSGYFGLSTSYAEFSCAAWTIDAADPYPGPWDAPLSAAPLVVNTTHDPSTPMQNAEAMADLLPGAVLLRVNGYGHTSLLNQSTCANDLIAAYLVDQKLPPPNTWCTQDRQPFED
ncbi:alpha/beta hydrolase [Aminobacter sp. HY435]|uniref:alpha/beta hydrolase n=1 Tax=Aminobacter sp. HY435 TaxID=2970917 RepID=UPI0022B9A88C|nr:alpha/beta hydrolase [Aminobacter sp. HY435]